MKKLWGLIKKWFQKTAWGWIKKGWLHIVNLIVVLFGFWLFCLLLGYWIFWKFFGLEKFFKSE
jgi:Kef-type K+ transport system membrane component KefB